MTDPKPLPGTDAAIGVHIDGIGNLIIEQECRHVILNPMSVPELCKLMKKLAALEARNDH